MSTRFRNASEAIKRRLLLDPEDKFLLNAISWGLLYDMKKRTVTGLTSSITLGRLVMVKEWLEAIKTDADPQVVHLNGNPLDYRRSNLQIMMKNQVAQRRWRKRAEEKLRQDIRCQHGDRCKNKATEMRIMWKSHHYRYFCQEHIPVPK